MLNRRKKCLKLLFTLFSKEKHVRAIRIVVAVLEHAGDLESDELLGKLHRVQFKIREEMHYETLRAQEQNSITCYFYK
jgi:hypothetical protein